MIRKARLEDVRAVYRLISEQSRLGSLLPRAMSDIYAQLRDFTVIESNDGGEVVGCGALHIVWEDLAEIRSLAVETGHQNQGMGTRLVQALLQEAVEMGIKEVFVLTYKPSLFERLEFHQVEKGLLPHKIWADCIRCSKFPACDEIALVKSQ